MNIEVTFESGSIFVDRARDMHNAVPRAKEWLGLANVTSVRIINQQQVLWEQYV